jgi:acetyltransferase-like isoleucine patch superfamily enzyme
MSIHGTAKIHKYAIVDECEIGAETRVWAFAHVMGKARVGARCNLGEGVFVEEGVVLGDDCTIKNGVALWDGVQLGNKVFVGPNAVFTNVVRPRAGQRPGSKSHFRPTIVANGVTIGANATILCGVSIGQYAFIGAGTVVIRDVPSHALVVGNPGRIRGWVCQCALRLDGNLVCRACNIKYQEGEEGLFPVHEKA